MEDIVTIDGPTSSGKNSVGFLLSKKLGYQYIDTGMIYRAGCLKIFKENVPLDDLDKILGIFKDLHIRFETNDKWKMFLDGVDVTDNLHTPQISKMVPQVAAMPQVREVMKSLQRDLGKNGKIVMGGRDIGSEIYPQAKFKFFLTAKTEIRAQRRYQQLLQTNSSISYEEVLKDMAQRDKLDTERKASPLRIPPGAVIIDNSKMSVEQTVDKMLKYIVLSKPTLSSRT